MTSFALDRRLQALLMTKEPKIFLQDIVESIDLIEKRMKNVTYDGFVHDIDLQDMIIRRLEIIGEAVRNLPKEFRQKHAYVDWRNPADMRSALIHGYSQVDLDIIWDTIINDLPPFKEQVNGLLEMPGD